MIIMIYLRIINNFFLKKIDIIYILTNNKYMIFYKILIIDLKTMSHFFIFLFFILIFINRKI
jgi:hypothetical protein